MTNRCSQPMNFVLDKLEYVHTYLLSPSYQSHKPKLAQCFYFKHD
uniref:Uncharacterized protein n=1 Tax=Anguilla anguilla TaxID=7936 RepID=A0A0E9PAP3_ANGAN